MPPFVAAAAAKQTKALAVVLEMKNVCTKTLVDVLKVTTLWNWRLMDQLEEIARGT